MSNELVVYTRSKARSKNNNEIGSSSSSRKRMEVVAVVEKPQNRDEGAEIWNREIEQQRKK